MLLGLPPDMVHSPRLRKTHPSSRAAYGADYTERALKYGNHPCYSGFQVQGTATTPASMAISDLWNTTYSITNIFHICKRKSKKKRNFLVFSDNKSTVYTNDLPRDKAACFTGEKKHSLRHLTRGTQSAERCFVAKRRKGLIRK